MERQSPKKGKTKPSLIIQTSDVNSDYRSFKRKHTQKNQVEIKPLMSAKNKHQMKNNFHFPALHQRPFNLVEKHEQRLRTLQRLETEKIELMQSLQILKQGAVSAIVEKEEQIQKLKQHIYESSISEMKSIEKEQEQKANTKLIEKELALKESYQKELEDEVEELRRQLRKQRISYESELYEKEEMINSLCNQLDQSYQKIQILEKSDEFLTQKIRNVELQNLSLLKELETSQYLTSSQFNSSFLLNISTRTNKARQNSQHSEDQNFEQSQNISDLSYASTIPIKKYSQFYNEEDEHLSNSVISQRIQFIKEKHKQEVEEIKQFYEQEIKRLKKMYEKDSERKTDQKSNDKGLRKNSSVESLKSSSTGQRQHEEGKRLQRYKSGSNSNFKLEMRQLSLEGIQTIEPMQSIIEHGQYDESGTPRNHTLKQQILQRQMYPTNQSPNYDTLTTASNIYNYFNNKNSSNKSLLNCDTLSQFTANHFEYPFATMDRSEKMFLRTTSIATYQGQTFEAMTKETDRIGFGEARKQSSVQQDHVLENSPSKTLSMQSSEPIKSVEHSQYGDIEQIREQKGNMEAKECGSSLRKDIMLFCMGLLTGGTLISLGKRIINK